MIRKFTAGIANLSSYTSKSNIILIRENLMKYCAMEVITASNIFKKYQFYTGNDKERMFGLMELMENDDIDIVFFLRGGYGAVKTLKYYDERVFMKHNKPMVGMSDLTAFFIYHYQKTGYFSYHGPNLISEFLSDSDNENKDDILNKLDIRYPCPLFPQGKKNNYKIINHGTAEGKLIGGNLSTIVSMIGTPWISSFRDHILFLEDTGERPYKVDRMLFQCFSSGLFENIKGVLIGDFSENVRPEEQHLFTMVYNEYFKGIDYPVISNLPFGHGKEKPTIPIGGNAYIDTRTRTIELI